MRNPSILADLLAGLVPFRLPRRSAISLALAALTGMASSGCRDSNASSGDAPDAPASSQVAAPVKDVVLPGIDISAMTPRERHEWTSLVSALFAPCPNVPASVAQCVEEKRACGTCVLAAKWIARSVREGMSEDQIQHAYKDRFDPSGVKALPLDGSPSRGPTDAPVTIVEFADFECPHCREAVPAIDALMAAHPDKIRLVYKVFTLPFHMHGETAARSAMAAGIQGKFWEMEHLLFDRQQHLEDTDLERYAQMLHLDMARWKSDMDSAAVKDRIAQDHKLGEELKLKGTPTIYIDGRELELEQDESLDERVAAELGVIAAPSAGPSASSTPAAPPGSAAPSASAAHSARSAGPGPKPAQGGW